MTELMFVRLREDNEHEGEIFHYWLQLDGNEKAIAELAEALSDEYFEDCFQLRMETPRYESEVDILVEEAEGSYMASDQKFTGRLEWPIDQMSQEDWDRVLYKGSIKNCFKED